MYVIYWGYEDESDAGVVVPPDDAAVCVGDVGGEEGDVVRLPEERHAVERGQQRERNLNSKIWMGVLLSPFMQQNLLHKLSVILQIIT